MKLSIITINLNNRDGLQKTIESVVNQTFIDYEYIIVDGGSTDGSVEIIEQYADKIIYWVSEPDKGIYIAMNKGILQARGEYCLFLNSGDTLVNKNIIEKVFKNNHKEDIIYGNLYVMVNGKQIEVFYPNKWTFKTFLHTTIPHPASFIRKSLFSEISLYDESLRVVADWAFFVKAVIIYQKTYIHLSYCISNFDTGGLSAERSKNIQEKIIVLSNNPFIQLLPQIVIELHEITEIYEQKLSKYKKSNFLLKLYRLILGRVIHKLKQL